MKILNSTKGGNEPFANSPSNDESKKEDATVAPIICGSCYGSETEEKKCCNTCAEVSELYRYFQLIQYFFHSVTNHNIFNF